MDKCAGLLARTVMDEWRVVLMCVTSLKPKPSDTSHSRNSLPASPSHLRPSFVTSAWKLVLSPTLLCIGGSQGHVEVSMCIWVRFNNFQTCFCFVYFWVFFIFGFFLFVQDGAMAFAVTLCGLLLFSKCLILPNIIILRLTVEDILRVRGKKITWKDWK